ncbi:MAG: pyridoxal-phosphate dependent enzyme [Candidatus Peribacteraceae bacterium]|nr:pyridoxal-phosphate dependent enzyme [Candidatus Peribacteraceae bacterium]
MNSLHKPTPEEIRQTRRDFPPQLIRETPLEELPRLSALHGNPVYVKDEGKQNIRSYKGRGSTAIMQALSEEERSRGVVCASAGNHAQGVAAACHHFRVRGTVFMPTITPEQKIEATKRHGGDFVAIALHGDTFDEASQKAHAYAEEKRAVFLPPFDNWDVIRGQGTVAVEIAEQMAALRKEIGAVLVPVGGGGLMAGTILALKDSHPHTQIIGVEPAEAASMTESLKAGKPVTIERMDKFVDGAAVARPGDRPFAVISHAVEEGRARMMTVSKGLLCATMVDLYQIEGIITEPAGALSIAAVTQLDHGTQGTKVCILSGTNFDIRRNKSVTDLADCFRHTKIYVGIHLPNRPGALREMLDALAPALAGVNIEFMHFDTATSNGDPPLCIGIASRSGNPIDIDQFLQSLSEQRLSDGSQHYPFHVLEEKPET